jgi:hypothetical protein
MLRRALNLKQITRRHFGSRVPHSHENYLISRKERIINQPERKKTTKNISELLPEIKEKDLKYNITKEHRANRLPN